jgi:hypothetical protein
VEAVRRRCQEVHGAAPDRLHELPESFERAPTRTASSNEEQAVVDALAAALAEEPA